MKKIVHIDMDAFFASVEQRDQPALRGKPIAVGGQPDARGVVATASYEARKYGIHSAMPMATAQRLCPQLTIIPSNHAHYRAVSGQIFEIFERFSDNIEPLSIDEAYIDVSENYDFQGSATLLAQHIIDTIHAETDLTASAGVSYCKFLAKYASTVNKPNGVFTIAPRDALAIIADMPVGKFHGIGPVTEKKLNQLNIYTGKDLRNADFAVLESQLGKMAKFYYRLAHGEDNREVLKIRERKSLGNETTFSKDVSNYDELWGHLQQLLHKTWELLDKRSLSAQTITIKIKYHNFTLQTKRHTERTPIEKLTTAEMIAKALLTLAAPKQPVRLVGVTFSQLSEKRRLPIQLRLFD